MSTVARTGHTTAAGPSAIRRARARRRWLRPLAFLAPALALSLVFFVAPLVSVVYQSLTSAPLIGNGTFVGVTNYVSLLTDSTFLGALGFGAAFTVIASVLIIVGAYGLALIVRRKRRGTGVLRAIYLLPFVIGLSTLSYMALLEFRPQYGSFNQVLHSVGLGNGNTAWLLHPGSALFAVALVSAWASVGFGMILIMSSMQAVPEETIEAARVDGAGWLQREWFVVFPMVKRTVALVSITTVAGSLLAFTQFFILTQGGPGTTTSTPVIIAYKTAIAQFHLGYASAISVVLLVIIAVLTVVQFRLFRVGATDE
ncbi:sugar ABC transporter permease [Curtobacterium sp. MCBD17_040]|uniref:carbohydrate ABC transporter permease n=1 Tax=Curtobacterium sp. MCBD17_040 TaxID=2175674 RepID=UPI000DA983E7|nr:sugar ABC transporter permease [Curtobacterium sp. MCBD17_040]WIB65545.1 sugar ABC transporter permease [Curtobacterium sp. MCBD17_040]